MQELETNPFYSEKGEFVRSESLVIDSWEYVPVSRCKPSESTIQELREQKRKLLEAKKENSPIGDNDNAYKTLEYSIWECLQEKRRGLRKREQINKIIELIQEIQRQRHINDINRDYLNTLLKWCNIPTRTKERLLNEIISRAKIVKERGVTKKFLVGEKHYEQKIFGEKTKSSAKPVNRIWEERKSIVNFYSFIS